jgi:hypothetical protein
MDMDKQQIELIGTAALTTALIRERFEVAHPMRDRGIDLIVFSDSPDEPFSALPVQVQAHTGAALMVQRKYEKFKGLLHAVVWQALSQQPRYFLFDHEEAVLLVPESSRQKEIWTRSDGHWTWTDAPQNLQDRMAQFENRWDWLRSRLKAAAAATAQI